MSVLAKNQLADADIPSGIQHLQRKRFKAVGVNLLTKAVASAVLSGSAKTVMSHLSSRIPTPTVHLDSKVAAASFTMKRKIVVAHEPEVMVSIPSTKTPVKKAVRSDAVQINLGEAIFTRPYCAASLFTDAEREAWHADKRTIRGLENLNRDQYDAELSPASEDYPEEGVYTVTKSRQFKMGVIRGGGKVVGNRTIKRRVGVETSPSLEHTFKEKHHPDLSNKLVADFGQYQSVKVTSRQSVTIGNLTIPLGTFKEETVLVPITVQQVRERCEAEDARSILSRGEKLVTKPAPVVEVVVSITGNELPPWDMNPPEEASVPQWGPVFRKSDRKTKDAHHGMQDYLKSLRLELWTKITYRKESPYYCGGGGVPTGYLKMLKAVSSPVEATVATAPVMAITTAPLAANDSVFNPVNQVPDTGFVLREKALRRLKVAEKMVRSANNIVKRAQQAVVVAADLIREEARLVCRAEHYKLHADYLERVADKALEYNVVRATAQERLLDKALQKMESGLLPSDMNDDSVRLDAWFLSRPAGVEWVRVDKGQKDLDAWFMKHLDVGPASYFALFAGDPEDEASVKIANGTWTAAIPDCMALVPIGVAEFVPVLPVVLKTIPVTEVGPPKPDFLVDANGSVAYHERWGGVKRSITNFINTHWQRSPVLIA
jgi:hypothetical protein